MCQKLFSDANNISELLRSHVFCNSSIIHPQKQFYFFPLSCNIIDISYFCRMLNRAVLFTKKIGRYKFGNNIERAVCCGSHLIRVEKILIVLQAHSQRVVVFSSSPRRIATALLHDSSHNASCDDGCGNETTASAEARHESNKANKTGKKNGSKRGGEKNRRRPT